MKNNLVPLRSFIFDRLYHPQGGYFCKPGPYALMQISRSESLLRPWISNPTSASTTTRPNSTPNTQKMLGSRHLKYLNLTTACPSATTSARLRSSTSNGVTTPSLCALSRQGREQAVQPSLSYFTFRTSRRKPSET